MKLKFSPLPFFFAGLFAVIYILAAAFPLSQELQLVPEWTVSISQQPSTFSQQEKIFPFKSSQLAGYFSESGKIFSSSTFPVKIAISDSYYAPFGLSDNSVSVYSPDGKTVCELKECGFPFIEDDRIFMFLPGGSSFCQFSNEGKKLWTYEGFVPVTAFSSTPAGCAAGFADGKVLAFNPDGSLKIEFIPGGSRYPAILGVSLSSDGSQLACLSGIDKQRIVLARVEKEHSVITFYKYLEKDQTHQSFVKFSNDNKWLYYSYTGGLGIVNCEKSKCTELKMDGTVISLKHTEVPGTFFVLTRNNKKYNVYVIENYTKKSGSFSFDADSAFIETCGNELFVGRNSKISKIQISKE